MTPELLSFGTFASSVGACAGVVALAVQVRRLRRDETERLAEHRKAFLRGLREKETARLMLEGDDRWAH